MEVAPTSQGLHTPPFEMVDTDTAVNGRQEAKGSALLSPFSNKQGSCQTRSEWDLGGLKSSQLHSETGKNVNRA